MKNLLLYVFLILSTYTSFAQDKYRYLVLFKDKSNSPYSLSHPEEFLSAKSIQRRQKNQVAYNEQDIPVNSTYLKELSQLGAKIIYPLKWINGALIQITPSSKSKILANEHVKGFYYPFAIDSSVVTNNSLPATGTQEKTGSGTEVYGTGTTQIVHIGLDHMHNAGIKGDNVLVTLLDDGFTNVPSLSGLKKIIDEKKIIATLATTPDRKSVFEKGSHGTNVLSVMANYSENNLIGGAYNSYFALAQTEESEWEKLVEEVNWLRGAEWADSLGTDVIQSSLGYTEFDLPLYNHTYVQMNGNTSIATKAANWATDKGIICVISAGNEGTSTWKYISAPADAVDILTVGAVSSSLLKIGFSSYGPSSDGRIKPDICALGTGVKALQIDGSYEFLSGTSFAAPLVSSLVAGLVEQFPNETAQKIKLAVKKSASLYTTPNNNMGYGVPSYEKAVEILTPILATKNNSESDFKAYPNPVEIGSSFHLSSSIAGEYSVNIINTNGQILQNFNWQGEEKNISLGPIAPGKHFIQIKSASLLRIIPIIVY
ncbi:T9SS type A sorting domain-containing protein [Sandaracinomonas limnophila]|uniref:T9SS type A sorting domain-containing protein n=1 Tax=Sandaracinomonas limnophila TaxID=1862386 RepID=A0A437PXQ6_9BACT|nr:S8 family peptidase [Sandaracinomonas limnophila]RVU27032.1 T9SS type A sorting domain-containing protein [Sandaracinomonas limnophila]